MKNMQIWKIHVSDHAGLTELGQKNEKRSSTCADLIGSLKKWTTLKKNHPERFFPNRNCRYKHDWNCCWINYW
jgi:hypothetical protein